MRLNRRFAIHWEASFICEINIQQQTVGEMYNVLQRLYLIIQYVMMLCNWALAAVERFAVERACASMYISV